LKLLNNSGDERKMERNRLILAIALISCVTVCSGKQKEMTPKIVNAGGFDVIGISVRTDNRAEMSADGKIPKLWARIYSSNVIERIPNKTNKGELMALYYDYESDKDGEYSYMIGAAVSSTADVPEGMSVVHVPEGKYAVFTTERGPASKVVPALWKQIWAVKPSEPGGDRTYKVDYELYDEHDKPDRAQVDIYIGIK
jgi:predicted transcriptional regulator YdeE